MTENNTAGPQTESPEQEDGQGYGGDYPLQDPKQDPRWAVNTVRIWLGFALFSLGFILALMILGIFYD